MELIKSPTTVSNRNYTRYSLDFKSKCFGFINEHKKISECSRVFEVERKLDSRWFKHREAILDTKSKRLRTRKKDSKDRAAYPELERRLISWFSEQQGIKSLYQWYCN